MRGEPFTLNQTFPCRFLAQLMGPGVLKELEAEMELQVVKEEGIQKAAVALGKKDNVDISMLLYQRRMCCPMMEAVNRVLLEYMERGGRKKNIDWGIGPIVSLE